MKKLEKEKVKWEKGKFAVKSIVAEIDARVVENGSVGGIHFLFSSSFFNGSISVILIYFLFNELCWCNAGHLLTRLAEKGLSFRITSNPIEKSILWKMNVPDNIAQVVMVPSI
ncbi:hypothetical protein DsansV1_C13g0122881 [Dioscorea sansibarensis]